MSVFTNRNENAGNAAAGYVEAILELLGDRSPTDVLDATPDALRRVLDGVSEERIRLPEAPGKWCPLEVVQHLADSDLIWAWRLRLVVAHERPEIVGYDQDRWAGRLHYRDVPLDLALRQFETLRATNRWLIDRLEPDDYARVGMHQERGEESLELMLQLYAGHDLVHMRQIERMLGAGRVGS